MTLATQEGTTHTVAYAVIPRGILKGDESGAGSVMVRLLAEYRAEGNARLC